MSEPYSGESLDQAVEVSLETVKKRAVRGVAILTGRGFFLNAVSQVSWLMLLAFLTPSELGTFLIVSAAVAFLMYFSDIGLAAALIQKREKPAETDLRTTFLVQQMLVGLLLVGLWVLSPYLVRLYSLTNEGRLLLYALGGSLFLSSLKSIPSVLLERKLEFGKFVLPEIVENLVYNVTLVFLAWKGLGITSFTWAVLARGVAGVAVIYCLQPWVPGFAFSKKAIGGLLKFGVPYQINSLVSVFKDQGVTLILGGILGQAGIGILGTAMRLSQMPLRLFMDNVTKVSFPAMARMQGNKEELAGAVTRSVKFITFLVFPSVLGMALILGRVVEVIPKYQKWEAALVPFYIVTVNVLFAAVATQLTNMLTAVGKIKTTIKITIMYTGLTIGLVPLLAMWGGVNGAAAGYALVGVSSVVAVVVVKRLVNFSLVESVVKPGAAAGLMVLSVAAVKRFIPVSWVGCGLVVLAGAGTYWALAAAIIGQSLVEDGKKIFKSMVGR